MGGPESRPFLQRFITISSIDQRYFTEMIPSPHHKSIKCCQYAYFTDSTELKFQLTYQHALARKGWIWDMNQDILVQNPTILYFLFCVSLE